MITDSLQMELFVNSPTFRRQVANALTTVGVTRWKAATTTIMLVDAAEQAGQVSGEQLIARQFARTERAFLENAMAIQGVNIGGFAPAMPPTEQASKEGITRLINMMLTHATWTWTVDQWVSNQATANAEIELRINDLLQSLAGQA